MLLAMRMVMIEMIGYLVKKNLLMMTIYCLKMKMMELYIQYS